MKGIILLNASENTRQVEEEEKSAFVKGILDNIGIPMPEVWGEDGSLSVQGKIKLRSILSTYNVNVIDDKDGELTIYVEKEKVALWKKPTYILKRDFSQIDPKKKLFLEMHTEAWTVFENADG